MIWFIKKIKIHNKNSILEYIMSSKSCLNEEELEWIFTHDEELK